MVGAGFVLFAGTLVQANRSLPFTVGLAVSAIPAAVLAHLVLAFPDGRLHSGWERIIVGAAYLNAIVVQIVMLMFMGLEQVGGCPCPHNLLFVRDDMTVHMRLMNIERDAGHRCRSSRRARPGSALAPAPRLRSDARSSRSWSPAVWRSGWSRRC